MPKVLIVEDDTSLREILRVRLQAEGYETFAAADGEEGLRLAVTEKPDLVIADIMMPRLSGFDMLKNLRSNPELKDVKVIIYTALGAPQDRAVGEGLGVVKYLVKSQDTITDDLIRSILDTVSPAQAAAPTHAQPSQPQSPPSIPQPSVNPEENRT